METKVQGRTNVIFHTIFNFLHFSVWNYFIKTSEDKSLGLCRREIVILMNYFVK